MEFISDAYFRRFDWLVSLCLICQANAFIQLLALKCQVSHWALNWNVWPCLCHKYRWIWVARVGWHSRLLSKPNDMRLHSNAHQIIIQMSGQRGDGGGGGSASFWQYPAANSQQLVIHAIYDSCVYGNGLVQEMSCLLTGDMFHILKHVADCRGRSAFISQLNAATQALWQHRFVCLPLPIPLWLPQALSIFAWFSRKGFPFW